MVPVRCFSCGKVVASEWEEYQKKIGMGEDPQKVLDSLGLTRYCCRRMLLSNADTIDDVLPFG
ncbi:MAG: DNA-directed RNA polymerase subunit N [Candidatus Thermoplasmatota archaeon]|nr:DNA-directed RNA polymerase subunit N [Candidatus Thermoplasmatota archaeon]MCJ2564318.1 DNA-directed RNA polymerase subunit N [Candidatus Thermoplasmatota archaeon]